MKTRLLVLICSFLLLPSLAWGTDFFWVGGTGAWNDIGHWATTSGGSTIHFGIPSANDDVFFDINSFSSANDQVNLGTGAIQCGSITVSTALPASFIGSGILSISGSLDLASSIIWNYSGSLEFRPIIGTASIDGRDHTLGNSVTLLSNPTGGWHILSDLRASGFISIQPSQLSFNANVKLNSESVTIVSDGRTDYSDLTINSANRVNINAVQSEAFTLETCSVEFSGNDSRLSLQGIPQFPLRGIKTFAPSNFSLITSGELTTDTLIIYGNGTYSSALTLAYFELQAGTNHSFNTRGQIKVEGMKAIGDCASPIILKGFMSPQFFANASATLQFEYIQVENIEALGTATWNALESSGTGNINGWNFSSIFGPDRYWVGNSGAWEDINHWSYTSGGVGGACLPTIGTNVIFDAASFTVADAQVELSMHNLSVNSFDCSATNLPFTIFMLNPAELSIYGSMSLSTGLTWTGDHPRQKIIFKGDGTNKTIRSLGKTENLNLIFQDIDGEWTLLDSLSVGGGISIQRGRLTTNNYPINCGSLSMTPSGLSYIDFGNSIIHLRKDISSIVSGSLTFEIYDCNSKDVSIFSRDSSLITNISILQNSFTNGNGIDQINCHGPASLFSSYSLQANLFDLRGSASIDVKGSVDSLLLKPGASYELGKYDSGNLSIDHLSANGTCKDPIEIIGNNNFEISSPNNQQTESLQLLNVKATGGPWNTISSTDLGGNSGWNFTTPSAGRTLYWSGGSGTWFDPTHWSESNGGLTGVCPPTRLDNVIFPVGSLSPGDEVFLSQSMSAPTRGGITPECKMFDARGITDTQVTFIGWDFDVFGSFYAPNGLDFNLRNLNIQDPSTSSDLMIEGVAPKNIKLSDATTYNLLTPLRATLSKLTVKGSTLRTNGLPMELYNILLSDYRTGGILDLDDSEVKLFGTSAVQIDDRNSRIISNGAWLRMLSQSPIVIINENTGGVNLDFRGSREGTLKVVSVTANAPPAPLSSVYFKAEGKIVGAIEIDSLFFNEGFSYVVQNSTTEDLTIKRYLTAVGGVCNPILLSALTNATENSTIKFETAAESVMDYVRIDRVDAIGSGSRLAGKNSENIANASFGWIYQTNANALSLDRQFLGPDRTTCEIIPDLISADVPASFAADFRWSDGSTDQSFRPPSHGTYFLDITFDQGACSLRDSIVISIPDTTFFLDELYNVCDENSIRVNFPSSPTSTNRWIVEAGAIIFTDSNGADLAAPGIYLFEQTLGLCVDSSTYEINFGSVVTKDSLLQFCEATSFTTSTSTYHLTQDTSFIETFLNTNGCDSIVSYLVDILGTSFSDSLITGCTPLTFKSMSGVNYSVYQDSLIEERFTTLAGCDSIRRYEVLVVEQPVTMSVSQSLCTADTFTTSLGQYYITQDSSFTEVLTSSVGCDSTVSYSISILPEISSNTSLTGCDSVIVRTQQGAFTIYSDTTFSENFTSVMGCDSLINYSVHLSQSYPISDFINIQPPSCFRQNNGQINLWDPENEPSVNWSLDGTPLDEVRNVIDLPAGLYALSLSYGFGCSVDTIMTLEEPPRIALEFPDTILSEATNNVTLNNNPNTGSGPLTFNWSASPEVGNLGCSNCSLFQLQALSSGWIFVEVQDTNGCIAADSIWLSISGPKDFYLPTAFSPNNDGINDILQAFGSSDMLIEDVQIFDRWGSIIHSDYPEPQPLIANIWNGEGGSAGVYVVLLTLNRSDGRRELIMQDVSLMK